MILVLLVSNRIMVQAPVGSSTPSTSLLPVAPRRSKSGVVEASEAKFAIPPQRPGSHMDVSKNWGTPKMDGL